MTLTLTIADADWTRVLAAVVTSHDFDRMSTLKPGLTAEEFALSVMWQAVSKSTLQHEYQQAVKAAVSTLPKPAPFTDPIAAVDGSVVAAVIP